LLNAGQEFDAMTSERRNILLMLLMVIASILAIIFYPTHRIADDGSPMNLETMIPKQFGEWQEQPQQTAQIINPQQKELLAELYSQTISRTYVNAKGDAIMLTIAYGADQSDAKQLHYPEVCYPAQGFQVISNQVGTLKTNFGSIKVRRLFTLLNSRNEPLTYWTTVGNQVVMGGKETKLAQLRYGIKGQIPDGLLFRVSSITPDAQSGYNIQQEFVSSLLSVLSKHDRMKLAGLIG
jgi:EpsI family protein